MPIISVMTDSKEVDKYLKSYSDDVELYVDCKRDQWLDWLSKMIELGNENFSILIAMENEKTVGYAVIMKCLIPPITESFNIMYVHSQMRPEETKQLWDQITDWAKQLGAKRIEIRTNKPELMQRHFGFQEDGFTNMFREL